MKKYSLLTLKTKYKIILVLVIFLLILFSIIKVNRYPSLIEISENNKKTEFLIEKTDDKEYLKYNKHTQYLYNILPFSFLLNNKIYNYESPIKKDETNAFETEGISHKNIEDFIEKDQLINNLYTIEAGAFVDKQVLNINELLDINNSINIKSKKPKVLIFHTHSKEAYLDSKDGVEEETVVGMGNLLAEILSHDYALTVVHDKNVYDENNIGDSYEIMSKNVAKILAKYPSIEIVIDLHRDGLPDDLKLVKNIKQKDTAMYMFVNGVSALNENGAKKELEHLPNDFQKENLAFSLDMHLNSNELYPGLSRKLYIKPYRYSLYMAKKSLLLEAGANTNTVEEARNLMPLIAEILYKTINNEK